VVDLASPDEHPLAKIGKDVGAAAVLVAALAAILIGLLILGPPFWLKLSPLLFWKLSNYWRILMTLSFQIRNRRFAHWHAQKARRDGGRDRIQQVHWLGCAGTWLGAIGAGDRSDLRGDQIPGEAQGFR
jgi:hypothetical protein